MMQWTKAQKSAIESLDGTLIVSAAAGSGKTSVLVQRVINRLTNTENPCDANQLLIVTFTRAATSEMRERIDKAITEKLKSDPTNPHLIRQKLLLPSANICTIDSFCNDLVKENFFKLGINPDFKIISESERKLLAQESANEIIEELYSQDSYEFKELVEFLFKGRDDSELAKSIIELYDYSQAYAFPEKWLKESLDLYSDTVNLENNKFLNVLFNYVSSALDYFIENYKNALNLMEQDEVILDKYSKVFGSELKQLTALKECTSCSNWDKLYDTLNNLKFIRLPSTPRGYTSEIKDIVTSKRKDIKSKIEKKIKPIVCCSADDIKDDLNYLQPIVGKLFEATTLFRNKFIDKKKQQNYLDFSDITHLAINLLIEENDGEYIKTPLAKELSEKYVEILIDEYQDTNKAQDILFSSISRDGNNLFMVGDVKQSIYRFRKAMPEIFIEKRNSFETFEYNNYPGVINLDKNYRSRQGVVGFINFIFSQIMSNKVGEVCYDETEKLKFGANYDEHSLPDTEVHIVDTSSSDEANEKPIQIEAKHIANTISDMIKNGTTVQNKDGTKRLATYKDFCILLRSTKNRASVYSNELLNLGIPAFGENSSGFFDTYEVQIIVSLLKVLDNPINDIPLLSLLMSPIYAFTPDDIANLRIRDRNSPLYTCIVKSAKSGNTQCKNFIDEITILRKFAAALPVCELIRKIYNETDFMCLVLAMENGSRRCANLNLLLDFANTFDKDKANGLSSFIRFIDNIKDKSIEIGSANDISPNANVVQIMSIHKSKGLEFPICIIANCSKKFNKESIKSNMILHPKLGVGMTRRNTSNMHEFETIMHLACKLSVEQDELSEEMRVLYVAMTRAREKLICTMTCDKLDRKIATLSNNISNEINIPDFAVKSSGSYADWILTACLRHPDAISLRNMIDNENVDTIHSDCGVSFKLINEFNSEKEETSAEKATSDENLMSTISEKCDYTYPYENLRNIPTKCAASHKNIDSLDTEYFATSKPSFLNKSGLTPAQRGTALHKFMQFANYSNAFESCEDELNRLVKDEFLSEEEGKAIDISKAKNFFTSNLYNRMLKSSSIMREKKFAINVDIKDIYNEIVEDFPNDKILIQGIADCAFVEDNELVIVDYKTDRVKTVDSLVSKYKGQLEIYYKALGQCTGLKIKEALLYSFELNQTVKVI